ncbi:uncharacterized protein LOC135143687 [Zophobas morio]|uniref:uncharacterized protein LOC135143687 n=1 Tax=Zophobas morio TaxID=2755281 RepID=UPI0030831030
MNFVNFLFVYIIVLIIWTFYKRYFSSSEFQVKNKHVLITGGSSGLGFSFAKLCVKNGANVTIVSRSQEKLDVAVKQLRGFSTKKDSQKIESFACDVTCVSEVEQLFCSLIVPVDIIVLCAGASKPGFFHQQSPVLFKDQVELNYLGSVYAATYCFQKMLRDGVCGAKFIFISSACGLLSFPGYSQYAATKFALRGFCDAFRGELLLFQYTSHIFFASSIDSPGFAEEQKLKPELTKKIEGTCVLQTSDQAAASLWTGISRGHYQITSDFAVELLRISNNSTNPRNNFLLELLLLPFACIMQHLSPAQGVAKCERRHKQFTGHMTLYSAKPSSLRLGLVIYSTSS